MKPETDDPIPTRESLLLRLRDWDAHTSWKDFFDTYWKLIYGVARRAGLNDAEGQDVVQETILTVARKMPGFAYDPAVGSFKAWLMTVTRSRIHDRLRKKCFRRGGEYFPREERLNTTQLVNEPVPEDAAVEQLWDEEWHRSVLNKATERVKQTVSPKEYQLFSLHGLKGIPAGQVADRLNVSLRSVYLAKYKISRLLKKEVRAIERSLGRMDTPR